MHQLFYVLLYSKTVNCKSAAPELALLFNEL